MLRKLLGAAIALVFSVNTFAQKPKTITLSPTPIVMQGREFYIDSVVDNRIFKDKIGDVHVGMGNKLAPALLPEPLVPYLQQYFNTTVPRVTGQTRLIAVINELHVYEKIFATSEVGAADVDIAFCKLDSGILKIVTETFDTQESSGMDVSNSHGKRLNLALRYCLDQLNSSKWKESAGVPLLIGGEWKPVDDEHNILKAKQ